MATIRYYNQECNFLPKGRMKLSAWIKETIEAEGFKAGEICYIFCSQEVHLNMNREYVGHDYQTDIITFDYTDLAQRRISGDIFIDPVTVGENAEIWNTSPEEEMRRVIIHGILHLCGYKDGTDEEQAEMRMKENHYLERFK